MDGSHLGPEHSSTNTRGFSLCPELPEYAFQSPAECIILRFWVVAPVLFPKSAALAACLLGVFVGWFQGKPKENSMFGIPSF